MEEVNSFFNTIFKIVIPQINSFLKNGFPIPPLKPFFDLKDSKLTMMNRYILIDFVPIPCEEGLKLLVDLIFEKLNESYFKVKLSRQIMNEKPKNIPGWLKIDY